MTKALLLRMHDELPFSTRELASLIATAQYRYKVYQIPKRRPNEFRTIAQPSAEIKIIQRWLIQSVLGKLPLHKAATAYREGKSIADHAAIHADRRFLLKVDFSDFFPSITAEDVRRHLLRYGKMPTEDIEAITKLVCWRNRATGRLCLSIGAPSSPALSNSLLYDFDKAVAKLLTGKRVRYSRYADDLAFSTNAPNTLSDIYTGLGQVCAELPYPRLKINTAKTVFTSKAHRRVLVGMVLTPDGEISLGRERKRRLRSALYRFSNGNSEPSEVATLRGELAFAWSVERAFVLSLVRQRGADVFEALGLPFSKSADDS